MPNFKFQKKTKARSSKRWMSVLTVFLAGLGLGVFLVGQGFVAAVKRAGNPPIPPLTQGGGQGGVEGIEEEGFRDPLISLVKPTAAYRPETPLSPEVREDDPVWGDRAALVKIVLFGDAADAATAGAWKALRAVWETRQNEVQLVWKDFPSPLNPLARPAAIAARCAQQQGKFWEYIEEVTSNKLQVTNFVEIAQAVGLEKEQFEECLSSPEPVALVNRGMEEAQLLEVDAAPTVFVGPYRLSGEIGREEIARLVSDIIDQ